MGCMFRSDEMSLCDMFLQPEVAFQVINRLGHLGCVQFTDMTPDLSAFQRHYTSEIRRLNNIQTKLNYVKDEINKNNVYVPDFAHMPDAMQPYELNEYENKMEKNEQSIRDMGAYSNKLMKNYKDLNEYYYVLTTIGPILGNVELRKHAIFARDPALGDTNRNILSIKTGVVQRSRCFAFEMMLWRISKGNIYFRTASKDRIFEDPLTGEEIRKVAFIAVCQADELTNRMDKICDGFHVTLYTLPNTRKERYDSVPKLEMRLFDMETVLNKTKYHRCKVLHAIGRHWNVWDVKIKKAKAIYATMNLLSLDYTRKCLIGQCWIPTPDVSEVNKLVMECSEEAGSNVKSFLTVSNTEETPPTYHRTNKFTHAFQALISAYGDSKYREVNPGLYTIITFPFLFAVMFGDIGHALIMTPFATWMIINEKTFLELNSKNEIWNIFFGGRYIILMMGLFSMYTGFLYNDAYSLSMRLMPSYWVANFSENEIKSKPIVQLEPVKYMFSSRSPYWFGLDPAWILSLNKIMTDNSIKMKMSIIVGVVHMFFGIILSLVNHRYFKHSYAIYLEFIPQILFLTCLFGWLVFMIFYKWLAFGAKYESLALQPGCAPLILILFIDMMLLKTSEAQDKNCQGYMFEGQKEIQTVLLVVALLSVPVMLFGAPIYLHLAHLKAKKQGKKDEEYIFAEVMIHQGIHTIEFVLSTISHTASYLRLWALSLAHAQLSEMLWHMILIKLGFMKKSPLGGIILYCIFAVWALFTLSILVIMEGLSAFLHTLRLHWVEFMSKFFVGGGQVFRPFCFKRILSSDEK